MYYTTYRSLPPQTGAWRQCAPLRTQNLPPPPSPSPTKISKCINQANKTVKCVLPISYMCVVVMCVPITQVNILGGYRITLNMGFTTHVLPYVKYCGAGCVCFALVYARQTHKHQQNNHHTQVTLYILAYT